MIIDFHADTFYDTIAVKKCKDIEKKESPMINPTDTAMSVAHALIFFSTVGCIVYGLLHWNRQDQTETVPLEREKETH